MKLNGNLTFNTSGQSELQNATCERLSSAPSGWAGRLYYNTTDNKYYVHNGTAWVALATGGDASALQTEVDAIETSLGGMVNGSGVFQGTQFNTANSAVWGTNPTSLMNALDVLADYAATAAGVDTLDELTDVTLTSPTANDVLQYVGGVWTDKAIGSASGIQSYDADLDALAALSSTGIAVRTGAATWATRSMSAPGAGFTITNPDGVSGSPTFALADDLSALEGLASTGFAVRTAANTWTERAVTGSSGRITVTNGNGVTASPTIDLDTLTDGAAGTFLKITRDSYGRVSGTTAVVASDITGLVDATYVNVSGDTMGSNADLVFTGGGEILGLPATPSVATAAASKAYVDNLVTSSTTWRDPIECPNFQGIVTAIPGSPADRSSYVKFGGTQNETWGAVTNVVSNDIMEYSVADGWERLGVLAAGHRFIVAADVGTANAGAITAEMRTMDLVEYVSGDANLAASWIKPHNSNVQGVMFGAVTKTGASATGLANNATVYTATIRVNASNNAISVVGSAAQTFTTLLAEINADLTGATATIVDGHIHVTGSNSTDTILITNTDLFSTMTDFSEIRGTVISGSTVLVQNLGSEEYGQTFLYSMSNHDWVKISGPGQIGAGVGLAYDGNTMNVNLGGGIVELPSDEVGIDLYSPTAGGIVLTTDGTTRSTATGGKLHILLPAGSGLAQDATGLYVPANGITNAMILNEAISLDADDASTGSVALGGTMSVLGVSVQGISTSVSGNTITVTGTNASTTQKGVASFDTAHFSVTSGAVSLAASFDDLTNVSSADAATTGDMLTKTAGDWQPISRATLFGSQSIDALSDVVMSTPADGQALINNGTNWVNQKIYHQYQGASATSHAVTHSIGQRYCNVTVIDDATHEVVIPESITFDSTTQLTVTFNAALACKVIVMGVA